ncbi:putative kinase inhibitor protein [Vibrio aerogenes CECT 7868]|uniref:Putative kinase inhibitor protein n=1 Tax=Vibrio aerogenes CECT 7868 TaxID=1216006 RepID=A0A1M5ZW58_9VIBR|nr:YbhB/YbcL family Raf kinase inhibitor-like protein [Vibrio aerogenes]SHI28527.1 putative kinase inhibitor protein [Vibrio aerogenes CECT 7868]
MKFRLFSAFCLLLFFVLPCRVGAVEQNVWYLAHAADKFRQGFIRVTNLSQTPGSIWLYGMDHKGKKTHTVTLTIKPQQTITLNSEDIEEGNKAKGLEKGIGPGTENWRLVLNSDLNFRVNSYERTGDGLVISLHDIVKSKDGQFDVPFFNPGSNKNQISVLRVYNVDNKRATVKITGKDDKGRSFGPVILSVTAQHIAEITAEELEKGSNIDLSSGLGNGSGKWRLSVSSKENIRLMSLLKDPKGHVSNLSSDAADDSHLSLYSRNFENGGVIPSRFSCTDVGGYNQPPAFVWSNAPVNTEKFALIMDDEIAPCGIHSDSCPHWSVVNIPGGVRMLNENAVVSSLGATENLDGYFGPCSKTNHAYSFTLYALGYGMPDISANILGQNGITRSMFESAYQAYILDKTTLMGVFRVAPEQDKAPSKKKGKTKVKP